MENEKKNKKYNRTAAGVMALFLGAFGIHKFYQKKYGLGILYVLLSWTGIPTMLGLFEGVLLLGTDEEESVSDADAVEDATVTDNADEGAEESVADNSAADDDETVDTVKAEEAKEATDEEETDYTEETKEA